MGQLKNLMKLQSHQQRVVFFKHPIGRFMLPALVALVLGPLAQAADPVEIFRTGDELVVRLDRFDLLREANPGLSAVLKLNGEGKNQELSVDLADPAIRDTLVMDLSKFGKCKAMSLVVKNKEGKSIVEKTVSPVPEVPVKSIFSASSKGPFAQIETEMSIRTAAGNSGLADLKIQLPGAKDLRTVQMDAPKRSISQSDMTYPVIVDQEAPLEGGCFLGRQTAAPKDTSKASLYYVYKKAIYSGDKLVRWHKFLAEIPVQEFWGKGHGDETVNLGTEIEVHVTNEVNKETGRNILGENDANLGQSSASVEDNEGRIYWVMGDGMVRFDPHTKKFERAPSFSLQKLCPGGQVEMSKSPGWLSGNRRIICTRGRVFIMDRLDYDNGQRRIGGLFSIPQDWRDPAVFAADIRLHVGTWETADPTFFKTPPVSGEALDLRKLDDIILTETGLMIFGKHRERGGPWRLDLDDKGNIKAFGEVNSLADTVSKDGSVQFPPTREPLVNGAPKLRKQRNLTPRSVTDGMAIPRAFIRPLLLSDGWNDSMFLPLASKNAMRTWEGAPKGVVTVKWDVSGKLKIVPEAQGELAASLIGGTSLGPIYLVTPIPGEPDKAVAICDYAIYQLYTLDFSSLADKKCVFKTLLPPRDPVSPGVGVYDHLWVQHDDEQWLYFGGYVGMSRIQYSKGGKVLDAMTADMFNRRIIPAPVDQQARGGLKQYDRLLPVFGGRLLDSGTGRSGRGGTPFSNGIEVFDPKLIGTTNSIPSQTAAYLSRCCGTMGSLPNRMVWSAHDGSRRQEFFGSAHPREVYVDELEGKDKALAPTNLDGKVFCYEVSEKEGLRDLFSFSLPRTEGDASAQESILALSPCHRFLLILTKGGTLYSYNIARKQFVDGIRLKTPGGDNVSVTEFRRPGEAILTAPDGQLFFVASPEDKTGTALQFNRLVVHPDGGMSIEPYLGIQCASRKDWQELQNCVRCFMPDLKNKDGSIDFIWGWDSKSVITTAAIRVITDFIPPTNNTPNCANCAD